MSGADTADLVLEVERIGVRGDGIALYQGRHVYLPLTAPGDRVRVRLGARREEGWSGEVIKLIEGGARQTPPCLHFGTCGGCALQHLSDAAYGGAKEALVREALTHRGLDPSVVRPLRRLPPATRRRARLALERGRSGLPRLGFHARASHEVVDLRGCVVLHPSLLRLVDPLRLLGQDMFRPKDKGAATMTLSERGVDLVLDLPREPDYPALERLATLAEAEELARFSWRPDERTAPILVAQRRVPAVTFSGVLVELPPASFLQASVEADRLLAALVLEGVGGAPRVADLYSGLGTLTFAMSDRGATVLAVDAAAASIGALKIAAARAGLGTRVSGAVRDLDRRPFGAEELGSFDAVVFDPPRAGARAQVQALAQCQVPVVVAVSCNPATFARDARILLDGGYRLVRVEPIDQFLWSPHVELVAHFRRA
ncbi:MAG TPA: class I SAM-dependent RNA methyltransferase [Stellaceae bacterium]|nr:class I SAM-dependent RNA methyltransferase [Stellaceae bacterium]